MTDTLRHIHLDAIGGVAGDMFVAAMLDALPALYDRVFADLAALLPPRAGRAFLADGTSGGLRVRRFGLTAPAPPHPHDHDHDHVRYPDLVALIERAALADGTAAAALAILGRLAQTESRIHGVPVDQVHFHEIADWDSLMDVVAAGSVIAALPDTTWSVSDLPRGGGRVRTRHGLMPVPTPATTLLLQGFRLCDDGVPGERVTPTGAAILAALVPPQAVPPSGLALHAAGMGAGTREMAGLPNVLRALVLAGSPAHPQDETVLELCFDVDDMTGEEIATAADRLRRVSGVLDVSLGQRWGKKGRPLTEFRLLLRPQARDAVIAACFAETSTIGLRWHQTARRVLPRRHEIVQDRHEIVQGLRVKRVERPGIGTTIKVESDDLSAIDGLRHRRQVARRAEDTDES